MAGHILLIRHGQAEGIGPGILLGSTDLPLSNSGRSQAETLRRAADWKGDVRCFSSPLSRAWETAAIATAGSGLEVEIDDDLRETDFGCWEGMSFAEAAERDPDAVQQWMSFSQDFAFPDGEKMSVFFTRIIAAGERLAAVDADTVVAFTHGGVIRTLLCHFLRLDFRSYVIFDIGHACVARLRLYGGTGTLLALGPVGGNVWEGEA